MSSNRISKQAAQDAAWKRSEQTMRHYVKMVGYFAAIIATTSTARWAVANIAIPAISALTGK